MNRHTAHRSLWMGFAGLIALPMASLAGPSNGSIVSGSGQITYGAAVTDIQQDTANMLIDWQSFNIQAGEQVNFMQPSSSAIALNRDFSGVASEIFGALNANGQVYLLNTAGVLIGSSATINVGGLLISDMDASDITMDGDTNAGSMTLYDADTLQGGITVEGAITTTTRNGVTLIAQFIDNSGTITANNGDVNLAIANGPIVVTNTNGTMGVEISSGVTQDISPDAVLLDNSGEIRAINGNINIDIQYLSNLNLQAVRNTGLVNAVGVGYGEINQNIVLQAPPLVIDTTTPADEVVSDSLGVDVSISESTTKQPTDNLTSLDRLVEDCQSDDFEDKECIKKRAIKRYLGRLLIGGSLPE